MPTALALMMSSGPCQLLPHTGLKSIEKELTKNEGHETEVEGSGLKGEREILQREIEASLLGKAILN